MAKCRKAVLKSTVTDFWLAPLGVSSATRSQEPPENPLCISNIIHKCNITKQTDFMMIAQHSEPYKKIGKTCSIISSKLILKFVISKTACLGRAWR